MHFSSILAFSGLLGLALALSGQATFYSGGIAGGTCSFSTYSLPVGIYGTALSDSNWDNAAHCGQCISVTYPGKPPITAMIVDLCPNCGLNHLDLFPDAFSSLAAPSVGVINVEWSYINCPITSPLQLHNQESVSKYWFSMQVVNANKAVRSLEVSTDGGSTWQPTTRQSYNFFQNANGFGTSTVDVKVTSVDGDVVVVKSVPVSSDTSVTASKNFGSSSPLPAQFIAAPSSSPAQSSTPTSQVVETPAEASLVLPVESTSVAWSYASAAAAPTSTAVVAAAIPSTPSAVVVAPTVTTIQAPISFTTIPTAKTVTSFANCTTSSSSKMPVSTTTVYVC